MKAKKWVKLIDLDNGNLIGYFYNPYEKSANEIKKMFIPEENLNRVKAIKVS